MQESVDEQEEHSPPTSEIEALHRKKKKGKRKRKQYDVSEPISNIPGVRKVIISPLAQKVIGCSVGEDVTSEDAWKFVSKEILEDNLEPQRTISGILPIKDELLKYGKKEILLGYIPGEMKEYDEFYICVTEPAEETVLKMIAKIKNEREIRLQNVIMKTAKPWKTQGSEIEVDVQLYKNNRPLLIVEIESKYPIMSSKCKFRLKLTETIPDGYLQFDKDEKVPKYIPRKKVDACTQVTPYTSSHEAQTIYVFPKNAWSQYESAVNLVDVVSDETEEIIQKFLSSEISGICDLIEVNNYINFYEDEYQNLIRNERYISVPKVTDFEEYISFADLIFCRGKKISSLSWHPMWTGTLAIAYSSEISNYSLNNTSYIDKVERIIYEPTPVLLWSFKDELNTKLYLETPREVSALSFCPYNENLLVGGCVNGQIIVWDIKGKLEDVEKEWDLSPIQQKYRDRMYSSVKWMDKVKKLKIIRSNVISDRKYAHSDRVSDIKWLSPFKDITKSGRILDVPDDVERINLMFMTSSHDGSVLIWDLATILQQHTDSSSTTIVLRKLKNYPSALSADQSPVKSSYKFLKPKYKIQVQLPSLLRLSALSIKTTPIEYVRKYPSEHEEFDITNRLTHEPLLINPKLPAESEFIVGTNEGEFLVASWEGVEVDPYETEEIVYTETCKIESMVKFHDGPIIVLSRCNSIQDMILSVGGKIFAIWKNDLKGKPILWKRSRYNYTHGVWDDDFSYIFRLTRSDGFMETWNLKVRSDTYAEIKCITGVSLEGTFRHPLKMKENIMGVVDGRGWFRTFIMPEVVEQDVTEKKFNVCEILEKEVTRKTQFIKWQETWKIKNMDRIRIKKRQETATAKAKRDRIKQSAKTELTSKSEFSQVSTKRRSEKRTELAHERWMLKQEQEMKAELLAKKGLNRQLLEEQQLPLTNIREENKLKMLKQQERLQNAEKTFNKSVARLFPTSVETKTATPLNLYVEVCPEEIRAKHYTEYMELEKSSETYIKDNKYVDQFDWLRMIRSGRERRRALDRYYERYSHRERIIQEKKKAEEEEKIKLLSATFIQEVTKKSKVYHQTQREILSEETPVVSVTKSEQKEKVSAQKEVSE